MSRITTFFVVVITVFFLSDLSFAQNNDLILIFDENGDKTWKFSDGFKDGKSSIFVYDIEFQNKIIHHIGFYEVDSLTRRFPNDDDPILNKAKNVEWLSDFYVKYFNEFKGKYPGQNEDGTLRVFDLNKEFSSIYMLLFDKADKKASLVKVEQLEFLDF